MTTFVLVPGAGGASWYWSRVAPLLETAGHRVVAVDLPADDPASGLPEYTAIVGRAIDRAMAASAGSAGRDPASEVVLVGQSLGGFTVAWVAGERPVRAVVLVNAMIPRPGETAGAWWENVGQAAAAREAAERGGYSPEFDEDEWFLHDVDPAVAAEGAEHERPETDTAFGAAWEVSRWPDVPVHVVTGAGDRMFPASLQQRVARERLGVEPVVLPGGHLMALSHPEELAAHLLTL